MVEAQTITDEPAELASLAYQAIINRDLNHLDEIGLDRERLTTPGPGRWPAIPALYPSNLEENLHIAFILLTEPEDGTLLSLGRHSVSLARMIPDESQESRLGLTMSDSELNCSLRLHPCDLMSIDTLSPPAEDGTLSVVNTRASSAKIPLTRNIFTAHTGMHNDRLVPLIRGNLMDGERVIVAGKLGITSYIRNAMNAQSVFIYQDSEEIAQAARIRTRALGMVLDELFPSNPVPPK